MYTIATSSTTGIGSNSILDDSFSPDEPTLPPPRRGRLLRVLLLLLLLVRLIRLTIDLFVFTFLRVRFADIYKMGIKYFYGCCPVLHS
jgi:hypothetical protein